MKERSRPVIGWGLGSPKPKGVFDNLQFGWRKRFLRSFDAIIAYSQRGAAEYGELGFVGSRVFVAPNAVVARPASQPPRRSKKSANQLTTLFVGRLQKRKQIDTLLRACAGLPNNQQPRLQVVGDGPIRSELQKTASNLYPKTEFLGQRFGKELEQVFDNADLFVLPGTGGLAIQQAMAHGLPVIAAEGDGSQEDMVTADNGWLIRTDDVDALLGAITDATSDIDRLRKMGEKSFELVQNRFNLEIMVDAFVDVFNTVRA
jgi:glycosyltransferase involved in cell wall biosynthesis